VKKVYFIVIALVIVMMTAVACTGAPKSQGSAPETPSEISPPPEDADEFPPEEFEEDTDEIAAIDTEDVDGEEGEFEETDLADAALPAEDEAEEEFPAEDELLAEEPEPPVVAAVPEPEPPPPPPPPVTPPPVTPRPATPPPAAPRPVTPPPVVTVPPPPPVQEPPRETTPPPPAEPPAVAREPLPRVIPELPNPTPAFRGRQDDEVVFSRVVHATVGQLVMVPFRGTGWVYLGEAGSHRGIVYDSRRLDPEGQSFIFRTEAPGEYALKFYRQDFIRDFILNDYVQVIVGDPPETAGTGWFNPSIDRGRVIAEPRWPTSLEEAQALRGNTQPSRPDVTAAPTPAAPAEPVRPPVQPPAQPPRTQTPPASPPPQAPPVQPPPAQTPPAQTSPEQEPPIQIPELEPDEYLQKAKEEFDAGRVAAAISYLNRFCEYYPVESDEVLWLYGQFYEANSPSRNILAALDSYRRLTREYPQSSRFDDARRRIAYLQRYYINIQ
jgi:hypothetical protein